MGAFKQFLKETENKPKVGMRFKHKRVLSSTDFKSPAEYVVTKVAKGVVYYKQPDERKAKESIGVEDFHKIVKEEVELHEVLIDKEWRAFKNPSSREVDSCFRASKYAAINLLKDGPDWYIIPRELTHEESAEVLGLADYQWNLTAKKKGDTYTITLAGMKVPLNIRSDPGYIRMWKNKKVND